MRGDACCLCVVKHACSSSFWAYDLPLQQILPTCIGCDIQSVGLPSPTLNCFVCGDFFVLIFVVPFGSLWQTKFVYPSFVSYYPILLLSTLFTALNNP